MSAVHTIAYPTARRSRPGLLTALASWDASFRSRRALAELPAERLNDVGVTAEQARREAASWPAPRWMRRPR